MVEQAVGTESTAADRPMPSTPPTGPRPRTPPGAGEDRRPARAQGPAHPDLGSASEEFAQKDADEVHRAQHQEKERDHQQAAGLVGHHILCDPATPSRTRAGC